MEKSRVHPVIAALAKERIRQGMTQKQLATAIGCQQSTISDIETGKTGDIQLSTLYRIAGALKVGLAWHISRELRS